MSHYTIPDHDPDTVCVWIDEPVDERSVPAVRDLVSVSSCGCVGLLLWWFPVGKNLQAMIAECMGECLAAGLTEVESLQLASKVFRNRRIGVCLAETATTVRAGKSVHAALCATNSRMSAAFLEAVRVGEERGRLAIELRAMAHQFAPGRAFRLLTEWTGRSKHAIQFAGILARLLSDHRLTPRVINDAGRIAAGGDKRFLAVVDCITEKMEDGETFAQSIHRFPRDFDPMFVQFVDRASSRPEIRINLNMLAGNDSA